MFKFFRHIRQRLLSENRFSKYMIYAIGEILLVVVGIIIALQINNWNEAKKTKDKEIASLIGLRDEMQSSLQELRYDHSAHARNLQSTLEVHQYITTDAEETDSMYQDFYNMFMVNYFFPKTSTYETLKSGNLELIASDTLRTLITDIYESGYERIHMKVETRRNAGRLLFPYYQKHFTTRMVMHSDSSLWHNITKSISIPNDYNTLINDPEFETLIAEAITGRAIVKHDFERTIRDVEECIEAIDRYLGKEQ